MDPILLIDLSSLWWPAYRATGGLDIAAANTAALQRVHFYAGQYQHVGIACDTGRSFRHDISEDYKANREKDQVARDLIRKLQTRLEHDGFAMWRAPGFEADDILATVSRAAAADGHPVVILTGDKDLLACVGPNVSVLNATTDTMFDEAKVKEKLGIPPSLVPAYLTLVGDAADNVPGVRGIGATNAQRLLNEFGSMERLVTNYEDITPPRIRAAFEAAIADGSLVLSTKLIALRYDVPGVDYKAALEPRKPQSIASTGREYETMSDETNAPEETVVETTTMPPVNGGPPPVNAPTNGTAETKPPEAPKADAAPKTDAPPKPLAVAAELIPASDPRYTVALEPRTASQAWIVAKAAFDSRMFQHIPNAEAAWLVILAGRSYGLDAMTMLRNVHIIEGKIALHAAMIVGLVLRSGKARYFKLIESTDKRATYKTHRSDDPDPEPTTFSFSWEDAERAQLTGPSRSGKPSNWHKIPRTMLRWRCATELARAVYPDVVFNLYSPDELGSEAALPDESAGGGDATIQAQAS